MDGTSCLNETKNGGVVLLLRILLLQLAAIKYVSVLRYCFQWDQTDYYIAMQQFPKGNGGKLFTDLLKSLLNKAVENTL